MKTPSPTFGLSARYEEWWKAAAYLSIFLERHPRACEIGELVTGQRRKWSPGPLRALLRKGFVRRHPDRGYEALEAPHETIVREVCAQLKISAEELFSARRTYHLARARRMIGKRLRNDHRYSFVEIARLLGRSQTVVKEYGNLVLRTRRSEKRRLRRIRAIQAGADRKTA